MQTFTHKPTTLLVLKRGESLMEKLSEYARGQNLKSAWVNVIGGADGVTLGFYNLDAREYVWKEFDEELEITGLQGNLVWLDGEPFWHIHGTFGRSDFSTISGHVKDLRIGLTAEVALTPIDEPLTREYDEETGLKLICPLS